MRVKRYKKGDLEKIVWWSRFIGRSSIVLTFISLFSLLINPIVMGYFLLIGLVTSIVALTSEYFSVNQLEMRFLNEKK